MRSIMLIGLGVFSLLMANESRHSAEYVLENPGQFGGFMFAESYHWYVNLDSVFTVLGVSLLLLAVLLQIKTRVYGAR